MTAFHWMVLKNILCSFLVCLPFGLAQRGDSCQSEPNYCSRLRSDECYQNYRECCRTCPEYYTGISGCEYGDYASVCQLSLCNSDENKKICCHTCSVQTTLPPEVSTNVTYAPEGTTVIHAGDITTPFIIPTLSENSQRTSAESITSESNTAQTTVSVNSQVSTSVPVVPTNGSTNQITTHTLVPTINSTANVNENNTNTTAVTEQPITTAGANSSNDNTKDNYLSTTPVLGTSAVTEHLPSTKDENATSELPMTSIKTTVTPKLDKTTEQGGRETSNGSYTASETTQMGVSTLSTISQNDSQVVNQTLSTTTRTTVDTKFTSTLHGTTLPAANVSTVSSTEAEVSTQILIDSTENSTTIPTPTTSSFSNTSDGGSVTFFSTEGKPRENLTSLQSATTLSYQSTNGGGSNETSTEENLLGNLSTTLPPNHTSESTKQTPLNTSRTSSVSSAASTQESSLVATTGVSTEAVTEVLPPVGTNSSTDVASVSSTAATSTAVTGTSSPGPPMTEESTSEVTTVPRFSETLSTPVPNQTLTSVSTQNQNETTVDGGPWTTGQTPMMTTRMTSETTSKRPLTSSATGGDTTTEEPKPTSAPLCVDVNINGVPCQTFLEERGVRLCYEVDSVCCATCRRVRQFGRTGCPYGDKANWCFNLPRSRCYHQNTTCCATCSEYNRGAPGCEYGDRAPLFCKTIMPWECYKYQEACCETCAGFREPHIKNCSFGDKTEEKVCQNYLSAGCVASYMKDTCCKTCWNIEPP